AGAAGVVGGHGEEERGDRTAPAEGTTDEEEDVGLEALRGSDSPATSGRLTMTTARGRKGWRNMARPKARQEAIDRANKAAHTRLSQAVVDPNNVGCNAWWSIKEGYKKDAAEVIAAWTNAGLDPQADLPEIPDGDKAFTR